MKRLSRRRFLESLAASGGLIQTVAGEPADASPSLASSNPVQRPTQRRTAAAAPIDRRSLVGRHNPVLRQFDPLGPMSVGNGEFAFTADITGLQTFPGEYENTMPLCTMSQWGWHTAPLATGLDAKGLRLVSYDTHGRTVGYATSSEGQSEIYTWLRENPHRLHLGQVGLRLLASDGRESRIADMTEIEQQLDLWSGLLTSRFRFEGELVTVRTSVHPTIDLLAVTVESALISLGRLSLRIAFPYGSPAMSAADWKKGDRHLTNLINQSGNRADLHRRLDGDEYFAAVAWSREASFEPEGAHTFLLKPARSTSRVDLVAGFKRLRFETALPSALETIAAASRHWRRFWTTGGAVELAESRDRRAPELERRIVLSQYLTAIQCAGSRPPQETGLTVNSWYGKFHLEMHWWHAAHFPLWGRVHLLEKSLGWYNSILPAARNLASSQGYRGARWPKMVGPEGSDSPSPIGPLLIWQQPHPIVYADLCYRIHKDRATLDRYREIVFETAEFMASYAFFEQKSGRYVLGPPVIPAQENHPPRETWNPTFELAYWSFGLKLAQRWRERCGLKRNATWDRVIAGISPLPMKDGVYLAHENCPQTYTERNHDHPSMLGALGVLSGNGVDRETMRRTLIRVMKDWQWDRTWGWDFPLTAMTAARLGEQRVAVDALLMMAEKNRYLVNGHNWQRQNLPCYLPGNGGLLYAVGLMAGGWDGAPRGRAPGFPSDGSWTVRSEGLNSELL
jgi:protein-glucosylgalactosylhydroxylysine glucosidase